MYKLVVLSGKLGVGKTTIAKKLERNFGYKVISIGIPIKKVSNLLIENKEALNIYLKNILENEAKDFYDLLISNFEKKFNLAVWKKSGQEFVKNQDYRDLTQMVASTLREKKGDDIWVKFLATEATTLAKEGKKVICDDLRVKEEKKIFEEFRFKTIRLDVSKEEQKRRIKSRGDGEISEMQLNHKTEIDLDNETFDYRIDTTNQTEDETLKKVLSFLKSDRNMPRNSWDEYFLNIAEVVSTRATCNRLQVGCVIVKDKHIISTGFNGSIHGHEHCDDVGCLINDEGRCIRTLHAEENAILHAEREALKGATAYITHESCEKCAKTLAQSGIKRIVFRHRYPNKWNQYFLKDIEVVFLNK